MSPGKTSSNDRSADGPRQPITGYDWKHGSYCIDINSVTVFCRNPHDAYLLVSALTKDLSQFDIYCNSGYIGVSLTHDQEHIGRAERASEGGGQ